MPGTVLRVTIGTHLSSKQLEEILFYYLSPEEETEARKG